MMSETIHQPNGLSDSTSVPPSTSVVVPPEIESTLSRLSAYRSVKGVMILSRAPAPSPSSTTGSAPGSGTTASGLGGIIQCTGAIFEDESGQRYATMVEGLVAAAAKGVGECDQGDELKMMRIRTKRHELIITPDEKYILVVLQDPSQ